MYDRLREKIERNCTGDEKREDDTILFGYSGRLCDNNKFEINIMKNGDLEKKYQVTVGDKTMFFSNESKTLKHLTKEFENSKTNQENGIDMGESMKAEEDKDLEKKKWDPKEQILNYKVDVYFTDEETGETITGKDLETIDDIKEDIDELPFSADDEPKTDGIFVEADPSFGEVKKTGYIGNIGTTIKKKGNRKEQNFPTYLESIFDNYKFEQVGYYDESMPGKGRLEKLASGLKDGGKTSNYYNGVINGVLKKKKLFDRYKLIWTKKGYFCYDRKEDVVITYCDLFKILGKKERQTNDGYDTVYAMNMVKDPRGKEETVNPVD